MHFLLLAPFVSLALASPAPYGAPPPPYKRVSTKCATVMGTQYGAPVHTAWQYHTAPCTVRSTRTITKTAAPGVRTSTRTITTTVTNAASTTTVPTTDGFIAIETSLPDSEYDGAAGGSPVQRRDLSARYSHPQPLCSKNKKMYPKAVNCQKWVPAQKCHTSTITKTHTVFPTPAIRTVTRTRTSTVEADATTLYAACATSNFADSLNGQPLVNAEPVNTVNYSVVQTDDDTAYDCCVAAQEAPLGAIWGYSPDAGCAIAEFDTCPADQGQQFNAVTDSDPNAVAVVLGNAGCGQVVPPLQGGQ